MKVQSQKKVVEQGVKNLGSFTLTPHHPRPNHVEKQPYCSSVINLNVSKV